MGADSTFMPSTFEPQATHTYIKPVYKRPETSQEKWARFKKEKRRARAIKNGRKFL